MAKLVFKDAFLSIGGKVLSTYVESVTLTYTADTPEKTAMADGTRTRLPGLLDWSLEVNFRQDFADTEVDSTLFALVGAASTALELRPTTAAVGADNPKWTGNMQISSYSPVGGSVGDVAAAPISFVGDGTLTRAVA